MNNLWEINNIWFCKNLLLIRIVLIFREVYPYWVFIYNVIKISIYSINYSRSRAILISTAAVRLNNISDIGLLFGIGVAIDLQIDIINRFKTIIEVDRIFLPLCIEVCISICWCHYCLQIFVWLMLLASFVLIEFYIYVSVWGYHQICYEGDGREAKQRFELFTSCCGYILLLRWNVYLIPESSSISHVGNGQCKG